MDVSYFLLYLLVGILALALYLIRRNFNYWKIRGIPHDEPNLLYGNLYGFRKTHYVQEHFDRIYKKYKGTGPFCGFYFLQQPMVFVLDTQLVKNILIKDFANFANRGLFYNEVNDPLTAHLFLLDGIKWKQLRHKLSATFTSGKMKFMFPTVVKVAEQFVDVFDELVSQSNTGVLEIKELLARFTTDVIGTCAFGIDCNSLKDPNAEFRNMGRRAFTEHNHGDVLFSLVQAFPKLARKLGFRIVQRDVHEFFMRAVRDTVHYREQNNIKRSDFMDMLIDLKNKQTDGLSIEEVAAQAFVFFLAGFETSSTNMGYVLYELAQHTNEQEKLRANINETLAKYNNEFSYECVKDMQYLNQVIAETLRLYTIVSNLQRQAINDYVVPGYPKYVIEKGVNIIIPACSIHRDADYYENPNVFDPERFSAEKVAARDSVEWLPFGDGPRNCIGMRFGVMQASIGLALLVKNFKFSICEETQIPLDYEPKGLVLTSKGGIHLRFEKI